MQGNIIYNGRSYSFKGVNDLPLQVVKAFVETHPNTTIDEVSTTFKPGLKGGAKKNVIKAINYQGDNRYVTRESVNLKNSAGTIEPCYISSQFSNSGPQANLPTFVKFIQSIGFTIIGYSCPFSKVGYHIININKNPILKRLKKDLFNKNSDAFDLMDKLDSSGLLMSEGINNWGLLINDSFKNPDYILFSSDKPTRTYGKYHKGDLIKSTDDLMSKINQSSLNNDQKSKINELLKKLIEVLLQSINCEDHDEESYSIKEIIKEISDNFKGLDTSIFKDIFDAFNSIEKVFDELEFTQAIWGVYLKENYPDGPCVVLFLNNILDRPEGNITFDTNELYAPGHSVVMDIVTTYVHELFHMVHLGMEVGVDNNDYGDKVVIEGLARYFEIMYSKQHFGTNPDNEIHRLLRRHSVISYPYSGACYIDRFNAKRFGEIVEKSTQKNHMALHHLLQGTKELETIINNL